MAHKADWLGRLVEIEPSQQSEIVREYDERFAAQPQIWSDSDHDAYVYEALEHFCVDVGRPLRGELLDVGCGNGHTLCYLASTSHQALNLTGLDFSPKAIQIAQSQIPDAQLYCADFLRWKPDKQFDFIISLGVFEHFPDPRPALRKVASLLKNEAIFYLEVPNCLWHGWSGRREAFRRHRGGTEQLEWHLHRSSWERLIAETNLCVLAAIRGPTPWTEFTWLLANSGWTDMSRCPELERYCKDQWRQARPRRLRHFRNIQKQRVKRGLQKILGTVGLLDSVRKLTNRI